MGGGAVKKDPSLWDDSRKKYRHRPLPTPPPSHTRRKFGAHICTSREHIDRLSSPRSRILSSPRSFTAREPEGGGVASQASFAAMYAHQGRWGRMATPPGPSLARYRRGPQSAPQLSQHRGLVSADGPRAGDGGRVRAPPRPRTSATPGAAGDDAVDDSPETWGWGGAPELSAAAQPAAGQDAVVGSASRASVGGGLQEEGSWFDQDAWSRLRADRKSRRAAQQEEREEYWRVAVRPWIAQRDLDRRETETQKRLRHARSEEQQLKRELEEKKQAVRQQAHTLLKDMRSLLMLDALKDMSPQQSKSLDRWVDDLMLKREIPPSLMANVEYMHESLIRNLFENIDEDGSGLLDKDEVRILASKLGASPPKTSRNQPHQPLLPPPAPATRFRSHLGAQHRQCSAAARARLDLLQHDPLPRFV
jgi:hypothetical protein